MSLMNKFRLNIILFLIFVLLVGCSQPAAVIPIATQNVKDEATETVTESSTPVWQVTDAGPLQFSAGATFMQTPGDLHPYSAIRFTVTALQGQQVSMWLTTEPASVESDLATLTIMDAAASR